MQSYKKIMRRKLTFFLILTTFLGCYCDKALHEGEMLKIPIEFQNFRIDELNSLLIYRIDSDSSVKRDTFLLRDIAFYNEVKNTKVDITDRDLVRSYGDYGSYFNDCSLVFDWETGTDTFKNMNVTKSRNEGERCHKDDPNIRIDIVSFVHKGSIVRKNEPVIIEK